MILCEELSEFCAKRRETCRPQTIHSMRTLLARHEPEIAEALQLSGDDGFLEPLLFAYLHVAHAFPERSRTVELPQIAYGYVDPEQRPDVIPAYADDAGCVYMPRIGYFTTAVRNQEITLQYDPSAQAYALTSEAGAPLAFSFESPIFVPGTQLELLRKGNPLFNAIFTRDDGTATGTPLDRNISCCAESRKESLFRVFGILQQHFGNYSELMLKTTRQLFLFSEPNVLSCARITAHGAVFLNDPSGNFDEPFLIQELVCRCAITLFNSMSPRPREFFKVDPYRRLDEFGISWGGDRNVYTALHGMFYECLMTLCLDILHERRIFRHRTAHEILGRLAFLHSRFRADIHELMFRGDILSDLGSEFYELLTRQINILIERRARLPLLDLTNQVGAFDYSRFAELNADFVN